MKYKEMKKFLYHLIASLWSFADFLLLNPSHRPIATSPHPLIPSAHPIQIHIHTHSPRHISPSIPLLHSPPLSSTLSLFLLPISISNPNLKKIRPELSKKKI